MFRVLFMVLMLSFSGVLQALELKVGKKYIVSAPRVLHVEVLLDVSKKAPALTYPIITLVTYKNGVTTIFHYKKNGIFYEHDSDDYEYNIIAEYGALRVDCCCKIPI